MADSAIEEKYLVALLTKCIQGRARDGESVRGFMQHQLVRALDNATLKPGQLLKFCRFRYTAASKFELLLERAMQLAESTGKLELANELRENLDDERGEGRSTGKGAHREWRKDFLDSLEVEARPDASMGPYEFSREDDLPTLVGMLIAAEYTIPLEDRPALKSLRRAFPDKFTNVKDEGSEEQKRTSRYLVDHIKHDAQQHFPDLMRAVIYDLNRLGDKEKLASGIIRFARERYEFYTLIQKQLGLETEHKMESGLRL
jgi:hypothetical protein